TAYCAGARSWLGSGRSCAKGYCISRGAGSGQYFKFGALEAKTAPDRLTRENAAYRLDDAVLRGLVEIGVHRQADDLAGELVADRNAARAHRIVLVGLLAVQRDRIIDRGRDALGLERRRQLVAAAARDADGVLRPDRGHAVRHVRRRDDAGE